MKDIHSHILYEIDDGAESINESINIIKKAINNGYTDIILTPHYRKIQGFVSNNKIKKDIFNNLKKEIKKQNLKINIYLGNEITVDEDLYYYLETEQIASLNNSRYLLLELPFTGRLDYLDNLFDDLIDDGYIIIIPHPERYMDYKEKDYIEWNKKGILFQGNIESLFDTYGIVAKNKLEKLLKHHLISFMGSDVHKEYHNVYHRNIKDKLMEILNDEKMVLELIDNNINKVINNEIVKPYEIIQEKKHFRILK